MFKMARVDAGMSQSAVAVALDIKQPSISAWEAGQNEPEREVVFRAEALFGLNPGTLSRSLGYGPPVQTGKSARAKRTVRSAANARDAILADPKLSKSAKEALLASYRAFISPSRCTGGLARQEPKTALAVA